MSMENPYESKDALAILKTVLERAPDDIKKEFGKGKNPWYACVNSVLTGFIGFVQLDPTAIPAEKKKFVTQKYQEIKEKVSALGKTYNIPNELPPQEFVQPIMADIKELRDML